MSMFDLSKEDEQKANAAAGSTLAMLFRGGAAVWSAAGKTVKFTTDHTASGLRKAADLVESSGNSTARFCERRSKGCTKKALKYSGFSEEEAILAMQALETELPLETADAADELQFKPAAEAKEEKDASTPTFRQKFVPVKNVEENDGPRDGRAPANMIDVEPAI